MTIACSKQKTIIVVNEHKVDITISIQAHEKDAIPLSEIEQKGFAIRS
jgi:hypothetical protein